MASHSMVGGSFAKVRERSPQAAALLALLAFLDPQGVPIGLLLEHARGLPKVVPRGREALDAAVAVLLELALVDREGDVLRMHRVVQDARRRAMKDATRARWASAVVRWVERVFACVSLQAPVGRVVEGIPEQVMVVATRPECQRVQGRAAARLLRRLARFHLLRGATGAAREACQHAVDLTEALATADPRCARAQRDLCVCLVELGDVELWAGDLAAARSLFQRGCDVFEPLARTDPRYARAQRDLAVCLDKLGTVEVRAGNLAAARSLFQRGCDVLEALANADPCSDRAQRELAICLVGLGEVEVRAGNLDAARSLCQRGMAIAETLEKADPCSVRAQRDLAVASTKLADIERQAGNLAAARSLFQRSLDLRRALAKADPHCAETSFGVVMSLEILAWLADQEGDVDIARQNHREALEVLAAMDAKGQVRGVAAREEIRETIAWLLARSG